MTIAILMVMNSKKRSESCGIKSQFGTPRIG